MLLVLFIILDIQYEMTWWYVLLISLYVSISIIGSFVMSMKLFTNNICKGITNEKFIAITFDDGPIAGKTDCILEILARYNVSATFFCIGSRIDINEALLRKTDEAGHLIGNHTFYHKKHFGFLSSSDILQELHDTDSAIEKVLQKKPNFFRPPFGVTNPMIARAVDTGKYDTIGWSVRSFDTIVHDPKKLLKRTTCVRPGDIVLFHDYSLTTIEILPTFIETVQAKGYRIVRLDELLNQKAYR